MKVFILITCDDVTDSSSVEIYGVYSNYNKALHEYETYRKEYEFDPYHEIYLEEHDVIE